MKVIYTCDEHLDEAMDDIININETFPIMEEKSGEVCSYCDLESSYKLTYREN